MASGIMKRVLGNRANGIFSTAAFSRSFSSSSDLITATLFPGDGIGPEIAESVKEVSLSLSRSIYFI